jgi:tRNA(Ile)-lysidine synthase
MELRARVLRTIEAHAMLARGRRALVALSGGSDSVALLHVLRELESEGQLALAGVAHFNHTLRAAADQDEAFCRNLAAKLGLPFEAGRGDVRALARAERRSLEDAARRARYAFLETAAERLKADVVAVGHTRDDQAETFLLRLLRGAGPRGLAGIRPISGRVIRPLIAISRNELRAYIAERRLEFREDESNADVTIARNRVRHELLPALREFSPNAVDVLAREADVARQDEDFLSRAAIDLLPGIVLINTHGITVEAEPLAALHPALASRVVREALERAAPGEFFGRDHIAAVLGLAQDGASGAVNVPGLDVRRSGSRLFLGQPAERARPFENSFRVSLSIPGEVSLTGWTVSASPASSSPGTLEFSRREVAVPASGLKLPLAVRSRRPGDRFRPLGMRGRGRKLQDFLVDRKIPRNERDTLPLVVDSDDRIVWVVGQSVAEDFRVTGASQGVILLKARRLGGEG